MRNGAAIRAAACGACLLVCAGAGVRGEKVFLTAHPNEADLVVFQTGQLNEADLWVYDGPVACLVPAPARWCYVANANEAELRVHVASEPTLADLKVLFVGNPNQAGWFRPAHDIVSSPRDTGAFPGRLGAMHVRTFRPAEAQFQWQRLVSEPAVIEAGWEDIPGATTDSLTLSGDDPDALGAYRVRVSSARGSLYSQVALFRILSLPRFSDAGRQPGGVFRMTFSGEPGFGYTVEGSDDLTNWFLVGEVEELTDGEETVDDEVGPAVKRRIYRIRVTE